MTEYSSNLNAFINIYIFYFFPQGWSASDYTYDAPTPRAHDPSDIVVNTPNRSDEGPCASVSGYCFYATGVGGACAQYGYEPPSGYWCAKSPPRGTQYSIAYPSGLSTTASFRKPWTHWRANESVVNAFRSGHWFSYVWLIDQLSYSTTDTTDDINSTANTEVVAAAGNTSVRHMKWTVGGFQGGEGAGGNAGEWNVENVLDELDSPNEWYVTMELSRACAESLSLSLLSLCVCVCVCVWSHHYV